MRWRINVFREVYAEKHLRNRVEVGEMVEEMEKKIFHTNLHTVNLVLKSVQWWLQGVLARKYQVYHSCMALQRWEGSSRVKSGWFSSECLKVIQSSQTHFFILMVIPQNTLLHLNSQTAPNQRQGNTFQPLSCVSLKSFCQTQTNKRQRYRKNWILSTCRAGSLWPVWQWTACVSWKVWIMKLPKIGRSDVWCIVRQLQQQ